MGNIGNMWTQDQERFFNDQFQIMTNIIVDKVSEKIDQCEEKRCCKGVDFKCLATTEVITKVKDELSLLNPKNVWKVVSIVVIVLIAIQISGGLDKVVKGIAGRLTNTEISN